MEEGQRERWRTNIMKNRPFRNFYKIIYIIFSLICIADIMLNLSIHTHTFLILIFTYLFYLVCVNAHLILFQYFYSILVLFNMMSLFTELHIHNCNYFKLYFSINNFYWKHRGSI